MSDLSAADLDRLRAFLPPIYTYYQSLPAYAAELQERVVDCEWDPDTLELHTIGVGNDKVVWQVDWRPLSDAERALVRLDLLTLLGNGVTIYHNADADLRALRRAGFPITAAGHAHLEDTMLADAVLHSEEDHDLGDLNRRHGRLPEWKHLMQVAPVEYNAADLVATYWVWKGIEREFAADPQSHVVYRTMSIPFIDLAIEGEEAGIEVDGAVALQLHDKYSAMVEQATKLAWAYTGDPLINLSAPDQLKQWAHKIYALPEQPKKGDREKVTLDKDALATLRRLVGTEWDPDEEPALETALANIEEGGNGLLEAKYLYSGAHQRLTHYVRPCLDEDGAPRSVIHPELRQHVQATGRHSYVGPAVQQMKGLTAGLIRPRRGTVWVYWDWSQIEVRLLAALADDEVYLDAYARGADVHDLNRVAIFGPGAFSPDVAEVQRGFVKRFVFRLHYRGLAKNAGDIPGCRALNLDATRLVAASEAYLSAHPALPVYWEKLEREAMQTGMVRTFMGRPRRLTSPYPNARKREACNHPMQGGVADIYCTTALLVKAAAPWARLAFGAHDAQTWEVPEARAAEFVGIAAPLASRPFEINGHRVVFPAGFKIRAA